MPWMAERHANDIDAAQMLVSIYYTCSICHTWANSTTLRDERRASHTHGYSCSMMMRSAYHASRAKAGRQRMPYAFPTAAKILAGRHACREAAALFSILARRACDVISITKINITIIAGNEILLQISSVPYLCKRCRHTARKVRWRTSIRLAR